MTWTPEEIVKRKWPLSLHVQSSDGWHRIWNGHEEYGQFKMLGRGESESEAWADAASRIEAQKEQHGNE